MTLFFSDIPPLPVEPGVTEFVPGWGSEEKLVQIEREKTSYMAVYLNEIPPNPEDPPEEPAYDESKVTIVPYEVAFALVLCSALFLISLPCRMIRSPHRKSSPPIFKIETNNQRRSQQLC